MSDLIKMKHNKSPECYCDICENSRNISLEMYDILFVTPHIKITLCDECCDRLFSKTLRAVTLLQAKTKSKHDMAIINKRKHGTIKETSDHLTINEAMAD